MKTKFTKASKTDKTLVTVTLAQFDNTEHAIVRSMLETGEQIVLDIEGVPTIFTVNRMRKQSGVTATSHCFPRFLRLPTIGRPTYANVDQVY